MACVWVSQSDCPSLNFMNIVAILGKGIFGLDVNTFRHTFSLIGYSSMS